MRTKRTNLEKIFRPIAKRVSKYGPEIAVGVGIAGMITTTILAVKATPKALKLIDEAKKEEAEEAVELKPIEVVKVAWKPYIPAMISGALSIGCVVGASTVHVKRNAALATAYQLAANTLSDYKEKVIETIGEEKEREVQKKVDAKKGVTASTSGWTTTVQSVSASKKYLWNYEIVKYTDGSIASTTAPCVIGSYGDTGEAGKNFNWNLIKYDYIEAMAAEIDKSEYVKSGKVICEGDNINSGFKIDSADCYEPSTRYILSGYITVISKTCNNLYFYNGKNHVFISLSIDGRNYSTPFNELIAANSILNDGKSHYFELRFQTATDIPGDSSVLYTYIQLNKSNATNIRYQITGLKLEKGTEATDWCPAQEDLKGEKGDTGATGKGVKSTAITYQAAANGTTVPTGTWVASPPTTTSALPYMWTRTIITYTDNTTSTSYSIGSTPEGIQVGGRNLAQKTSSKYYVSFSKFNGNDNVCFSIGNTLTDGLSVGDIISIKLVCKYTNIASVSGKTPQVRIIGAGNVTGWNDNGYFPVNNFTKLSGSNGEVTIIYQATINENHVKNSYWNTLLRTDAIQSGTIQCKMFKVERGTRYTDWTPAPEDVDSAINDVSESTNQYITDVSDSLGKTEEKLADLESNTNATLKLCVKEDETGRLKSMIEAIADTINITAKGGLNLTGNRFSVSSTNLTITKDGSMTCKNIVATGGTVGGWQIQSDGLYSMSGEQGSSLSLRNMGDFKGSSEDDLIISFRRWNTYPFYVTSGGELGCRKLAISIGYNKLNQRATTSANDTQAFNYAWTINGTGLFILNAGLWTDTTDDYGTTNCAIYVNGACVTSNTHRYGENSSSVELDAGATFVYWFRNANNQKVLLQAGSTKTGNKTLTYTVQGLFGLAVT